MSDKITVEGFVEKLFIKEGNNTRGAWRAFSLKLQRPSGEIDPRFYQFGFLERNSENGEFAAPPFKEGDFIRFQAEIMDDKVARFVQGSGTKPKNPPSKPASPQAKPGGYKGGGGGYKPRPPLESETFGKIGGNNTEDDIRRMSYAAARAAALSAVEILLANDGLPMSAAKTKAGQASRFEEITAAIDKLTVEYFFDAALGRKLSSVADAGSKESRVADIPDAKPGKAPAKSEDEVGDEPPQDDDDAHEDNYGDAPNDDGHNF